jgi:hypothetical protein
MRDDEHPIDMYISHLGRRLHLPVAERDQVLAEVRTHLEERAEALHQTGVSEEHAERQAVASFGPVSRIGRELRASHPITWGKRRWIVGMLTGAVALLIVPVVRTLPIVIYYSYFSAFHHLSLSILPTMLWSGVFISNVPFTGWSESAIAALGYPLGLIWMLSYYVLYSVLPFLWGRRAKHWWVPGLAYGLGTGLLYILVLFETMMRFPADPYGEGALNSTAEVIGVSLTLALAASFLGWWWRVRSASALGRAQAA